MFQEKFLRKHFIYEKAVANTQMKAFVDLNSFPKPVAFADGSLEL